MIRLVHYSFRFAEQVLNSRLSIKREIEEILQNSSIKPKELSRPRFNEILDELFQAHGWESQPQVFPEPKDPSAKMDFLKDRVGVEVAFGHSSFMGIDLLKFQVSSYSALDQIDNKRKIISERCKEPFENLAYTKEVIDGLYTLIAGAIGESAVVKALQQLSDDFYLYNDFSLNFDPPIYNKNDDDRIFSIQIDHLLVCRSGVFLLETKNWSRRSIENFDLRSPVKQILRTNYALFVLLNSDSKFNGIELEHHHWGSKKIPIRNVIVMTNEKPKEEFKHVKVLSLSELNGYIQYFEELFSDKEVESIFEYLKNRMNKNP